MSLLPIRKNGKGPLYQDESLSKLHYFLFLLVLILGTFLRIHNLGSRSLWIDEAVRAGIAKLPINQVMNAVIGVSLSPPLGDYILNIVGHTFGFGEFQLRFVSAVAGIVCIVLAYAIVRNLLESNWLALLIATMVSVVPLHIFFSQNFEGPYALWSATVWLSLYLYICVTRSHMSRWRDIAVYLVALSVASWLHYYMAIIIFFIILDRLWTDWNKKCPLSKDRVLLAHLWLIPVWIPLFLIWKVQFRYFSENPSLRVIALLPPDFMLAVLKSWLIMPNIRYLNSMVVGIFLILVVLCVTGSSRKRMPIVLLLGISFGMLVVGYLLSGLSHQWQERYFLVGSLGEYILAACGINKILSFLFNDMKTINVFIAGCIIVISALGLLVNQQQSRIWPYQEDWRSAARIVEKNWKPGSLIVFPSQDNGVLFDYYLPPEYHKSFFGLPWKFSLNNKENWKGERASQSQFDELRGLVKQAPEVWVVQRHMITREKDVPLVLKLLEESGYRLDVAWSYEGRCKLFHGVKQLHNSSVMR
jgi:4-amino-4-deoxy-L-arabinose transferase-like glycosyltransferase